MFRMLVRLIHCGFECGCRTSNVTRRGETTVVHIIMLFCIDIRSVLMYAGAWSTHHSLVAPLYKGPQNMIRWLWGLIWVAAWAGPTRESFISQSMFVMRQRLFGIERRSSPSLVIQPWLTFFSNYVTKMWKKTEAAQTNELYTDKYNYKSFFFFFFFFVNVCLY
jgi:hypothetical protein